MDDAEIEKLASQVAQEMGDRIEGTLISPLNDYLMADDEADASKVLRSNPQLMGEEATGLIDKFADDARRTGDELSAHRLNERRQLLAAHQQILGS